MFKILNVTDLPEEIKGELLKMLEKGSEEEMKEIIKEMTNKEEHKCDCNNCKAKNEDKETFSKTQSLGDFLEKVIFKPEEQIKSEKTDEKKNKKFWVVWSPEGRNPKRKHYTHEKALEEANRLARLNNNTNFFVLEATDEVVTTIKTENNKL